MKKIYPGERFLARVRPPRNSSLEKAADVEVLRYLRESVSSFGDAMMFAIDDKGPVGELVPGKYVACEVDPEGDDQGERCRSTS